MKWAVALSALWAILPAIPALIAGQAIGSPFTDLFPSIWSMWAWAQPETNGGSTLLLNYPEGLPWTPNSPFRSFIAALFGESIAPVWMHNTLVITARFATPMMSYAAGKAWGFQHAGALTIAAVFGCAPFFHGYALEGITEGLDGWALMLWAWGAGKGRPIIMAIGLALCVISSFYLGAACCLLAAIVSIPDPRKAWSFAGLILAAPVIWTFLGAFEGRLDMPDNVRYAMGMDFPFELPFFFHEKTIYAKNNTLGVIALTAVCLSRDKKALLIGIPIILAIGWPFIYQLPLLSEMRFPYRWHAATLAMVAYWAAKAADNQKWKWLPWAIAMESVLLSPMPFWLPSADAQISPLYKSVDKPILDIPGPLSYPPGEINPSRPRAQRFLYAQTLHKQPLGWSLDFNGLANSETDSLRIWKTWDPTYAIPENIEKKDIDHLKQKGIGNIMLHLDWLDAKPGRGAKLLGQLQEKGLVLKGCHEMGDARLCLLTDMSP